ncbi:hypothetical protein V6N13_051546 [Hibiscus sabdariffa]
MLPLTILEKALYNLVDICSLIEESDITALLTSTSGLISGPIDWIVHPLALHQSQHNLIPAKARVILVILSMLYKDLSDQ